MGTQALEGGFSAGYLASLTIGCTLFQVALKASAHKDHPGKTAFTDVSVQTHTRESQQPGQTLPALTSWKLRHLELH